jgi:hypothetical protein
MRGRLILPRRSRTAGGGRNVTPSYCGGTQRGTNPDSSRRGLVTDAGHARLGAKGVGVDIRCAASLSSWITTVRRRATVFAGASVSPKPRVFVDSGHAGEKVTTARLIAVEIVRKNTDQVGCVVNRGAVSLKRFFAWIGRNRWIASRCSLKRWPPSRSVDTRRVRFEHEATPVFAPRQQCVVTAPPRHNYNAMRSSFDGIFRASVGVEGWCQGGFRV